MKSLTQLREVLDVAIEKNKGNMKLINYIVKSIAPKGMNTNFVYMLFDNSMETEELNNMELLGLTIAMSKYLEDKNLNEELYFSKMEISNYDIYFESNKEERIDTIEIGNVIRISDREYLTYVDWKTLAMWRKNKLIAYDKEIQRASKIVKVNGVKIRKINVNKAGILDLIQRFKAKDIKSTAIAITPLLKEGKKPLFKYEDGKIIYKPVFDIGSENYCPCIIPDGFHRFTAGCDAYEESIREGVELEGGLGLFIQLMDTQEAKQYVADVFKRSDTGKDWGESLRIKDDSATMQLINKIDVLKDNIANTYSEIDEVKVADKVTIDNALSYANFDKEDALEVFDITNQMSKVINTIVAYIKKNSVEEIEITKGYWIGLVALGYEYRNSNKDIAKMVQIGRILIDNNLYLSGDVYRKNVDVKKVYERFIDVVKSNLE